MGEAGSGKRAPIRQMLDRRVGSEARPDEWCYVHNFGQPHKPRALRLPAGVGVQLRDDMQQLMAELQATIPAVYPPGLLGREHHASAHDMGITVRVSGPHGSEKVG